MCLHDHGNMINKSFYFTLVKASDWWKVKRSRGPRHLHCRKQIIFFSLPSHILLSDPKALKDLLVCSQSTTTPGRLWLLPHSSSLQSFLLPSFSSQCHFFLFPLQPLTCTQFCLLSLSDTMNKENVENQKINTDMHKKTQRNLSFIHPQWAKEALAFIKPSHIIKSYLIERF